MLIFVCVYSSTAVSVFSPVPNSVCEHTQALILYLSDRVNEPVAGVHVCVFVCDRVGVCIRDEGSPRTHSSGSLGAAPTRSLPV